MGLIYKVGNTIQGLPIPGINFFSTTNSITVSLLISLLLSFMQWPAVFVSHSVSLSVVAILQIIITCFLSLFLCIGTFQNRTDLQKFRFSYFFLGGFFIALACGYIFLDAFSLLRDPLFKLGHEIWLVSIISLFGNILIVQILSKAKVIPFRVKVLQIPFFSIIIFSIANLSGLLLMATFQWWALDPLIGLMEAVTVCLWGTVTFIDAYWKMVEIDRISMP